MSFGNINFLWGLVAIPVMALLLYVSWRYYRSFESSRAMEVFRHSCNRPSWWARWTFGFLKLVALGIILFALAEPTLSVPTTEQKYENIRIFFVVDVSGSMSYAEDVKPNRMVATKEEMLRFYEKLDASYQIGITPFAGTPNAYYCPPTYSKSTYIAMTKKLGPEAAPAAGTDLPLAMDAVHKYIKKNKLDESGVNIIVAITDGGKEEAEATDRNLARKTVTELSRKNCRFFFVGVGGKEPTPLMLRNRKGDFIDFVRDERGGVARSQLDEEFLKELAAQSNGEYKLFERPGELHPLLWETIERNRVVAKGELVYKQVSLQPYLLASSSVILLLCFIANRRRNGN